MVFINLNQVCIYFYVYSGSKIYFNITCTFTCTVIVHVNAYKQTEPWGITTPEICTLTYQGHRSRSLPSQAASCPTQYTQTRIMRCIVHAWPCTLHTLSATISDVCRARAVCIFYLHMYKCVLTVGLVHTVDHRAPRWFYGWI